MNMGMGGGGFSSGALNASGVDFANETQAFNFLQEILDDSVFQISGNQYARYFWYGVVFVIGVASIFNVVQQATLKSRFRAAAANKPRPAKPHNLFMKSIATTTAIFREASYPHFSPARATFWIKAPPIGTIFLLLTYLGFVLALEFVNNNILGAQYYTAIGVRAAWLAVAQIPLLILLAGKKNLIGLLTGVSFARLNIFHRWAARMLLLLATIHFGSQSYGWNEYGLMQLEWSTDTCPPTGIAAYAILLWINLSTLAPLRNLSYEFFVVQHLLTFFGFIIAVMFHLPSTAYYSRVYVYIPIALYIIDRLIRTAWYAFNNFRPGSATLQAMEGGVTKIRISNKRIKKWKPGSFVLLSIPRLGAGQSHPATIASIPESHNGDLVFILKSHKGFTGRLLKSATSSTNSLIPQESVEPQTSQITHTALIDGPYGGLQTSFSAFDTVVLISGSTGVTFTLSQFLSIAHHASSQSQKLPLRRLEFVWVVKNTSWTSWIADELAGCFALAESAGIEVSIQVFVTCDESFTNADTNDAKEKVCGCACDKSFGPCCCINIDDTEDDSGADNQARNEQQGLGREKKQIISSSKALSLQCATFHSGRPSLYSLISTAAEKAQGEMGIAVCGPMGLCASARTTVARISDERAVHKGTGAQGLYLHVESFCW